MGAIAKDLHFVPETTYVAVNFYDRYLSLTRVTMAKQFHLLALTCVYIAGKILEELREPDLKDMVKFSPQMTVKDIKVIRRLIAAYGKESCRSVGMEINLCHAFCFVL